MSQTNILLESGTNELEITSRKPWRTARCTGDITA